MNDRVFPRGSYRPPNPTPPLTADERRIVDEFHALYYRRWDFGRGTNTLDLHWMGFHTLKCPMDLWIYQEILVETEPDVIIETGTRFGGSAAYLASLCDLLGRGRIVTIDMKQLSGQPQHPRIDYILGLSASAAVMTQVKQRIDPGERVMVILDSDHRRDHVLEELQVYHPLVSPGCYLIVEDSNVNGHPAWPEHGPGPMEALEAFLPSHPEFRVDTSRERFLMTMNPSGFLLRTP
jgi:cephalosporin hydroxylase